MRVLVAGAALTIGACGYHRWQLTRDPRLSGDAAGDVEVGRAGPSGRPIEVRVYHLEEPATLAAGARSYVVWVGSRAGELQNLGALALRMSGDGHTSNGLLRANTPCADFRVLVTPEQDAHAGAPQHQGIFWASVTSQ